jgi:hypothetical protein
MPRQLDDCRTDTARYISMIARSVNRPCAHVRWMAGTNHATASKSSKIHGARAVSSAVSLGVICGWEQAWQAHENRSQCLGG